MCGGRQDGGFFLRRPAFFRRLQVFFQLLKLRQNRVQKVDFGPKEPNCSIFCSGFVFVWNDEP